MSGRRMIQERVIQERMIQGRNDSRKNDLRENDSRKNEEVICFSLFFALRVSVGVISNTRGARRKRRVGRYSVDRYPALVYSLYLDNLSNDLAS